MLVGDAIVVGLPDSRDESTDVPPDVADRFTKRADWRVEIRRLGDSECHSDDTTYRDYFEALVWAMITVSRWEVVEDARITAAANTDLYVVTG